MPWTEAAVIIAFLAILTAVGCAGMYHKERP